MIEICILIFKWVCLVTLAGYLVFALESVLSITKISKDLSEINKSLKQIAYNTNKHN